MNIAVTSVRLIVILRLPPYLSFDAGTMNFLDINCPQFSMTRRISHVAGLQNGARDGRLYEEFSLV